MFLVRNTDRGLLRSLPRSLPSVWKVYEGACYLHEVRGEHPRVSPMSFTPADRGGTKHASSSASAGGFGVGRQKQMRRVRRRGCGIQVMRELSLLPVLQRRVLQCSVARTQENMPVAPRTATPDGDWRLSYAACRADQTSLERVCGSSDSRLRCEHIGFRAWVSGVRGLMFVGASYGLSRVALRDSYEVVRISMGVCRTPCNARCSVER